MGRADESSEKPLTDIGEVILRETFGLDDDEIQALADGTFDMGRHLRRLLQEMPEKRARGPGATSRRSGRPPRSSAG